MAVVAGSYNPLPVPPIPVSGQTISFDGRIVNPGGAYVFSNTLINTIPNTFPGYIVGWPGGISANSQDQNQVSGVLLSFI